MLKILLPIAANRSLYNQYARYYDQGQLHFSILMEQYLREVLAAHPPAVAAPHADHWIDLACGTGSLALMLADAGWDVLGIDRAPAMLREAQRKARYSGGQGRRLRLRRADMRDWQPGQPAAVVSCCFDSLNYLLDETDLAATFDCVWAALAPGGLWLFDMNTPYFLEHVWQPIEVDERDDYVHVMHSTFNVERCTSTLKMTGFIQRSDGLFDRFEEFHAERGYALATIRSLLKATGFAIEMIYECFVFSPPTPQSHRWLWVARKPLDP